jgi:SAM-dependent methyltransferase
MTALREVKAKLGDGALCLLADVTNLPLKDGSMDAVVSLHTIYHIPQTEQATAFLELYRVVAPGGTAVVVYTWSRSLAVRLIQAPMSLRNRWRKGVQVIRRLSRHTTEIEDKPVFKDLYFRPQTWNWFVNQQWPFHYKIFTWRSVSVGALQFYFSSTQRGKRHLARLERLEDRFPEPCGRWGLYPLIVISDEERGNGAAAPSSPVPASPRRVDSRLNHGRPLSNGGADSTTSA